MDTTWGIADLLARHRGIIAVVGSGGKSTLLTSGGRALSAQGARVVLATSTHMLPPSNMSLLDGVERLDAVLARDGIAAVGALDATTGKVAEPPCGIDALAAHADYVLVEADGSRCLPLKAHATWEPVIPARASLAVLVVGAEWLRATNRPDRTPTRSLLRAHRGEVGGSRNTRTRRPRDRRRGPRGRERPRHRQPSRR